MHIDLPPVLFRYLSLQDNSDCWPLLEKQRLMFSNPCFFNDPFDIFPSFGLLVESHMDYIANREFASLPPDDPRGYYQFIAEFDKRRPLVRLKAQVDYPVRFRSDLGTQISVLCFSAKPRDIVMLSHYADNHRGIVIGFDSRTINGLGDLRAVHYGSNRPEATQADAQTTLFTKWENWDYEEEIRLVCPSNRLRSPDGNPKHFAMVEPQTIRTIYLGMNSVNCEAARDRLVRILLEPRWQHLDVIQFAPSLSRFELEEFALERPSLAKYLGIPNA